MNKKILLKSMMITIICFVGMALNNGVSIVKTAKAANVFEDYYNTTLKDTYGVIKKIQKGTMSSVEDNKWYSKSGLMGAYINDFDIDGKKEMIVCLVKKINSRDDKLVIQMYENNDGEVILSDEFSKDIFPYISHNIVGTMSYNINLVKKGKEKLIVLEIRDYAYFVDALSANYAIIKYEKNKLQLISSLTDSFNPESGNYSFKYLNYINNKKNKSEKYYIEKYGKVKSNSKYKSYAKAVEAYFKKYGIKINIKKNITFNEGAKLSKSILAKHKKSTEILSYIVKKNGTMSPYKFKAVIESKCRF